MKLIFGLLALLGVVRFADCAAVTLHPHVNFHDFRDGIHFTFFFKTTSLAENEKTFINFYDTKTVSDPRNHTQEIPAQLVIFNEQGKRRVQGFSYVREKDQALGWIETKEKFANNLVKAARNSPWWRIDVYKLNDYCMMVAVQGFWSKVRKFHLPLKNIKSAYIYGNIEKGTIISGTRYGSSLVKPTPLSYIDAIDNGQLYASALEQPLINGETSFNKVKLDAFPKGMLKIVAYMRSNPTDKRNVQLQFVPARFKQDGHLKVNGIFTIYQQWNKNKEEGDAIRAKKSYINFYDKSPIVDDQCTAPCSPVACVVDGTASDIEHYEITRKDGYIKVVTLYAGPDLDPMGAGRRGTTCTIAIPEGTVSLDAPFEIRGLNGASILHAEAF